jgi:hypothetical protein
MYKPLAGCGRETKFSSAEGTCSKKSSSDNRNGSSKDQKIWYSILANYEMIKGAQLSNSLIILKVLDEVNEPLNAGQISEIIARRTQGKIFKVAGALKDSLEHRLRRQGFVYYPRPYLLRAMPPRHSRWWTASRCIHLPRQDSLSPSTSLM